MTRGLAAPDGEAAPPGEPEPTDATLGSAKALAEPPGTGAGQLDRSLLSGIAWTGGMKWGGQVVAWGSTLIAVRLLSPSDYGLVGMATVYLGLITLLSEFGIGAAVVTLRDLTDEQIAQLNGLALLFGGAGVLLSWALAVPIGRFFGAPRLPAVVAVMSLAFLISALRTIPQSLLQKELRFKALAVMDATQTTVQAAGLVLFAALGFRYWALVIGGLLSAGVATGMVLVWRRHRMARPHRATLRHALTFSEHIVVGRLSWYAYSNSDFFVAGRILGTAALGLYTMAWSLASTPVEKITAMVTRIAPAFFAAVQHDHAELRRYLLALTEGMAMLAFPAAIGLALVAPDFVPVVLGAQWRSATLALQLLAGYAAIRSIAPLMTPVLNVVGETRYAMQLSIVAVVLLPAGFLVGSRWGITGIAAAWMVVHPISVLPTYARAFRCIQLPATAYLRALWPAASSSVIMALVVLAVMAVLPPGAPAGVRLAVEVAAGAAAYAATTFVLHRARLRAFLRVLREARQ